MCRTADDFSHEQLDRHFPSYLPKLEDAERYLAITEAAKTFAKVVIQSVPWSVDRDHAVQTIREAAMYAREALLTSEPAYGEKPMTTTGHKILHCLENSEDAGRRIINCLEGKSTE